MKSASEVSDERLAMLNPVNIGLGIPLAISSPIVGKVGWDLKEDGNDVGGVVTIVIALVLAGAGIYLLATSGQCPD